MRRLISSDSLVSLSSRGTFTTRVDKSSPKHDVLFFFLFFFIYYWTKKKETTGNSYGHWRKWSSFPHHFSFPICFSSRFKLCFLGVFFQVNHEEIRSGDHWEIISEKMLFWINRTCTSRRFYEFKKNLFTKHFQLFSNHHRIVNRKVIEDQLQRSEVINVWLPWQPMGLPRFKSIDSSAMCHKLVNEFIQLNFQSTEGKAIFSFFFVGKRMEML